jgi:hypothetical protein
MDTTTENKLMEEAKRLEQESLTLKEDSPFEDWKDIVSRLGLTIRNSVISLLNDTRKFKVGFWNSIFRKPIKELEAGYDEAYGTYMEYDQMVSAAIQKITATESVVTKVGDTTTVDTLKLITITIYSSQLSSQRETIRTILHDLGSTISDYRAQANNLSATIIALISVLIAVISLVAAFLALK